MTILQGLTMIDRAGLPHPEWEFVRSSRDLNNFSNVKDYVGWTIRTVEIRNGPWNNLYVNWLPKSKVPAKVDELQKKQNGKALFVTYPSWKWRKGGTILIEKDRIVIEVVKGAIVDLMRHGKLDASYYYKQGKLVNTTGDTNLLTSTERKRILSSSKKIKKKGILLEWGITTQGKFIFYRIEDIREAAKLLLKKYS